MNKESQDIHIAVSLSFLMQGFWLHIKQTDDNFSLSEHTDTPEDHFFYDCYPLAQIIESIALEPRYADKGFPSVFQYDLVETRAGRALANYVLKHCKVPTKEVWNQMMTHEFDDWFASGA